MKKQNKLYLGTNTKMFKTMSETISYLSRLKTLTSDLPSDIELFVIPSFTTLQSAQNTLKDSRIMLGAQNMSWEDRGQFTGEISPLMLKEHDVAVVEIGHSERRHVLGETDYQENRKVLSAIAHGFRALLCIGETAEQKNYDLSDEVLRTQLKIGLHGLKPEDTTRLWIAYEPVWAIGVNGVPASKEYASEKHSVIRRTLCELFGEQYGQTIPVLYGGSVNNENAPELIVMPELDGLFIGRSAWDADNFNSIISQVYPLWTGK